jgi:hypothetical protein
MDEQTAIETKRPKLVWAIFIFYLFSTMWTILSFYLAWSGSLPLTPQLREYLHGLNIFDYGLTVVGAVLTVVAAVALFRLRRSAVSLFWTLLAFQAVLWFWGIVIKGSPEVLRGNTRIYALTGNAIMFGVCLYSERLGKRGILKP